MLEVPRIPPGMRCAGGALVERADVATTGRGTEDLYVHHARHRSDPHGRPMHTVRGDPRVTIRAVREANFITGTPDLGMSDHAPEEIARELAALVHPGYSVEDVHSIVGQGRINNVLVVKLAGGDEHIVRLSNHAAGLMHYRRFAAASELLAERTRVPVAPVDLVVPGPAACRDRGFTAAMIQPRVEGQSGLRFWREHVRAPNALAILEGLWERMGEEARALHDASAGCDTELPGRLFGPYDARSAWWTPEWGNEVDLRELVFSRFPTDSQSRRMAECMEYLETHPEPFCLVHRDLQLKNTIVERETGALRGIIDWDFAAVQHRTSELAKTRMLLPDSALGKRAFGAFMRGYGEVQVPIEVIETRAAIECLPYAVCGDQGEVASRYKRKFQSLLPN